MPAGGATGTVLEKTSGADYATAWTALPASLPPSGAAGGDLAGSTYPNPVVAAGAITAAKLAPSASLLTPISAPVGADQSTIAATETLLYEATFTVRANRPLVVFSVLQGDLQCAVAAATNYAFNTSLRRGGTAGGVDGTLVGPVRAVGVTFIGQFMRVPFFLLAFDSYLPSADGTVRYSVTAVATAGTANITVRVSPQLIGLPFA